MSLKEAPDSVVKPWLTRTTVAFNGVNHVTGETYTTVIFN